MSSAVARWLAASLVAAVATEAFVVAPGTTSVAAIGEGRRAPGVRPRRAPWVATPALRATAAGNVASPEAAAAAAAGGYEPAIRIGHGFDIHRLAPRDEAGQGCVIGGVTVPDFELGTVAHSDGDVLYHSVTDAILGALTLPDIGQFFPDTDPRWKGCDSEVFLAEAWKHMDARGYKVSNLDVTLILQKPRVAPIKEQMKDNLVRVLQTSASQVNVKARTHEKVDSIGEGRALSCHAVLVMEKK